MIQRLTTMFLFLIVSFFWGTTFIAMKVAVNTIPPIFATSIRFLLSAPILIVISYYFHTPLLFPVKKKIFQLCICIFYFIIPFSLMLYSSQYVNSTISSIIFSTTPSMVLLFNKLFFKKKIYFLQNLGLILVWVTLFVILYTEIQLKSVEILKGVFFLILSMVSHAIIYLYYENKYRNISIFTFNTIPSLCSGLFLLFISFLYEHPSIKHFSNISIFALIYLGLFSGNIGILTYFYLQKRVNVINSLIVFFLFPLITLFLDYYIYGNNLDNFTISFIILLMFSVLLTVIPIHFIYIKKL
ncbi:MAG: DMT family transporter [Buchnera aphidicola (Chaetogeoica yunlongensis)]